MKVTKLVLEVKTEEEEKQGKQISYAPTSDSEQSSTTVTTPFAFSFVLHSTSPLHERRECVRMRSYSGTGTSGAGVGGGGSEWKIGSQEHGECPGIFTSHHSR